MLCVYTLSASHVLHIPGPSDLIRASLADKTWENYEYGRRKMFRWLRASGRLLDVEAFLEFLSDCADAHVCYDIPNFARCWLADYEKIKFGRQIITASPKVKMALGGYKKLAIARKIVKSPIRLERVVRLLSATIPLDAKLACLLAYTFLLRVSETVSLKEKEPSGRSERGTLCSFGSPRTTRRRMAFPYSSLPLLFPYAYTLS